MSNCCSFRRAEENDDLECGFDFMNKICGFSIFTINQQKPIDSVVAQREHPNDHKSVRERLGMQNHRRLLSLNVRHGGVSSHKSAKRTLAIAIARCAREQSLTSASKHMAAGANWVIITGLTFSSSTKVTVAFKRR